MGRGTGNGALGGGGMGNGALGGEGTGKQSTRRGGHKESRMRD